MDVAAAVEGIVDRLGDRVLFIGGVAVECHAPYRRTHDIDLIVRERDFSALRDHLIGAGFLHRESHHLRKHAFKAPEAGEIDVYTAKVGDVVVDEAVFRRALSMRFGGTTIQVVSLEDLLRLKLSAGREIDMADVAVILYERSEDVDVSALEALLGVEALRQAAPALPELLPAEYGWQAKQRLKAWLHDQGWL